MKKLLPILIITLTSLLITKEVWSLPNCPSAASVWNNCFGTHIFTDDGYSGDKYVGEYKNDKRHGQGTYTNANGKKYVGEFKEGKYHGKGTASMEGNKYVGEFKNAKADGFGTLTTSLGHKYTGQWKNNKMEGKGDFKWADGRVYTGDYLTDKKHG